MNNCEGKTPKYFPNRESDASLTIADKQNDCDDEATLEYELEECNPTPAYTEKDDELEEYNRTIPVYTDEDFCTDSSDEEEDNEMKVEDVQSSTKSAVGPRKKTLKQTTLESFFGKVSNIYPLFGKKGKDKKAKRWNDVDTENYRNGYPGLEDDPQLTHNLQFYTGKMSSYPDGDYIDTIHKDWFGNYILLERHHGYIQWLFPIREKGTNWLSQPLQLHEAKAIQEDKLAKERVLRSFKLILDFFGMELDETKGVFSRSRNWRKQYENLNWSSHNFLRITRILKSLGELGYEHLKRPFLLFLMEEALIHDTLPNILQSCENYWIGTIKNDEDRKGLYDIMRDNTN